jgi:hypothetical protein
MTQVTHISATRFRTLSDVCHSFTRNQPTNSRTVCAIFAPASSQYIWSQTKHSEILGSYSNSLHLLPKLLKYIAHTKIISTVPVCSWWCWKWCSERIQLVVCEVVQLQSSAGGVWSGAAREFSWWCVKWCSEGVQLVVCEKLQWCNQIWPHNYLRHERRDQNRTDPKNRH